MMQISSTTLQAACPAPTNGLRSRSRAVQVACNAQAPKAWPEFRQRLATGAAALATVGLLAAAPASAITWDELQSMSYSEVKGSGKAAICPTVALPGAPSTLKPGEYQMSQFCIEPMSFEIREDGKEGPEWVPTKLLTRLTYTLSQMDGQLKVGSNGVMHLKEQPGGMDFNVITLKVPRGEEHPTMFAVKDLDVKGPADSMIGDFIVPPYRGSSFMDPRGRGASTGYDAFQGLQARESGDSEDLARQNRKVIQNSAGAAQFAVTQADPELGEVGGVFQTIQETGDDMGARDPTQVRITGVWYAQLS